ncbi:Rho GTPase activation protein, partial [Serendipita vermifera]
MDEDLQRIVNAVIFNGGLDFDTRPMVVVTAAALPDPNKVDYDMLLNSILSYLDLYVEADYCVVFLAAGGRYSPGWSWIWKAYRSLSRKYRKNLKRLYIVHSSGFTRMLFSLAGAMISPKFYAKIEYVGTLSDLAKHVPITQMNIHPAVYSENLKYEREITIPDGYQTASRIFGVSLDELMGHDGESGGIPRPVKEAITYLRTERGDGSTPMEEHGLFRRSPSSALLKQVQAAYDRGQVVDLVQFGDANLAAVLIKKFFRALPDPIFPDAMFATIRKCPNPDVVANWDDAISYIREKILAELEGNKQVLLNVALHLLHDVSVRSSVNLMDAYNLAIVFTPNLVSNDNPLKAVQMSMPLTSQPSTGGPVSDNAAPGGTTLGTVIRFCIEHYYEIFDEIRDVSEAVP